MTVVSVSGKSGCVLYGNFGFRCVFVMSTAVLKVSKSPGITIGVQINNFSKTAN